MIKKIVFILLLYAGVSCSKGELTQDTTQPVATELVDMFRIDEILELYNDTNVSVIGKGLAVGDVLRFSSMRVTCDVVLKDVTKTSASFKMPEQIESGSYDLTLYRANLFQKLGVVSVRVDPQFDVQDKVGATIKGVVYCGKTPIAGVVVSDGKSCCTTDKFGHYWLSSDKYHGYVFICLPSGYEPSEQNNVTPKFWQPLTLDAKSCEQHNFELKQVDNENHIMIAIADLHLGGRSSNDDLKQFETQFIPEINKFVANHSGKRIYTTVMGDFTWDRLWYSHNFDIYRYKIQMASYPTMMFHTMGNHDNDPYISGDMGGESSYKRVFGPTYYSHNIGKVHYLIVDNITYTNLGASQGTIGDRGYITSFNDMQINWIKEDLARIKDKSTPIVVVMHAHSHADFFADFRIKPNPLLQPFVQCFAEFKSVHLMSGHSHRNSTIVVSDNLIEHNTAAMCGTFWWTGKLTEVGLNSDGTPWGYGVYNMNSSKITWRYKAIGKPDHYQFRAYDMNVVKRFFENPEVMRKVALYNNRGDGNDYKHIADNIVMVNIWNYDYSWSITATEDGTACPVERMYERDPLHTLCFEIPRIDVGEGVGDWATIINSHMFKITTSSPTKPVEIVVTDRFGNRYEQNMTRPKSFETKMN